MQDNSKEGGPPGSGVGTGLTTVTDPHYSDLTLRHDTI
jgi:hypothetical protein